MLYLLNFYFSILLSHRQDYKLQNTILFFYIIFPFVSILQCLNNEMLRQKQGTVIQITEKKKGGINYEEKQ